MEHFLANVGIGTGVALLLVNLADAGAHAFERYARSTPSRADDKQAAKILAVTGAVREFVDAAVGLLRPFKSQGRRTSRR